MGGEKGGRKNKEITGFEDWSGCLDCVLVSMLFGKNIAKTYSREKKIYLILQYFILLIAKAGHTHAAKQQAA